jgi:uncharacterized membrane protein HdeD (DUF308 family)
MKTPASLTSAVAVIRSQELMDVHSRWKFFLLKGVLVVVFGLLAVALPSISTLGIEQLVGWLFIVGGFLGTARVVRAPHRPESWWPLLSRLIAMALGVLLVRSPSQGAITLTILMMVLCAIRGVVIIFAALRSCANPRHRTWPLVEGLVTLMFAYLMWEGWPDTASRVIGLCVGISMIYLGTSLIFTVIAARSRT